MIQEIMQYIELIPEFKPAVRKVLDGLKAYDAKEFGKNISANKADKIAK